MPHLHLLAFLLLLIIFPALAYPQTLQQPSRTTLPSLTVIGLTPNSFIYSGVGGALTSTTAPTNGQLLIGSTGAAPALATLTGTANQITVTGGAGSVTLAAPQNLHAGASPTFTGLTLSGLTASRVPFAGTGGLLSDDSNHVWDNTNKRLGIGTASPAASIHVYRDLGQGFYEMLRLSNANGGIGTGSYISFASGGNPPIAYVGGLATGSNTFELRFYVANSAGNPFQVGVFNEFGVLSLYSSVILGAATYANLGTPANGRLAYCSDCTIASPCAGGGTGALAKRLNGVWVCN